MPEDYFTFSVRYPLFSKARPRLTKSGHAYMPAKYKTHQMNLRHHIRLAWPHQPLDVPLLLRLDLKGEGRGDVDNIAGAFMDCANELIWTDDNCKIVSELSVRWEPAPKPESTWKVEIYLL